MSFLISDTLNRPKVVVINVSYSVLICEKSRFCSREMVSDTMRLIKWSFFLQFSFSIKKLS